MRTRAFLIATALMVFVGSSAALAYPAVDTLLTSGYDDSGEDAVLVFGVSSIDQEGDDETLDCRLVGDFEYELDEEGTTVSTLVAVDDGGDGGEDPDPETDASDTKFYGEKAGKEGETSDLEPVEYGEDGAQECTLSAIEIEDANHGKVVSSFVHALKELDLGHGVGCLVRYVAQTEWGKDTGDDDEVTEPTLPSETTTISLADFETACKKGKKGETEDGDRGGKPAHAGQGKPPWAGPDGDKDSKPGKGPKNND